MSNQAVDVFSPDAAQRRLLVEVLASELEGHEPMRLVPARISVAAELCERDLVRIGVHGVSLTPEGRALARRLADHMLGLGPHAESCA